MGNDNVFFCFIYSFEFNSSKQFPSIMHLFCSLNVKNMDLVLNLHHTVVHTMKFVKKFHSVGLFSEQGMLQ
jgi:hypothetical protein